MRLERRSRRRLREVRRERMVTPGRPEKGFDRMTPIGAAWAALAKSARVDKCNRDVRPVHIEQPKTAFVDELSKIVLVPSGSSLESGAA